jgi:hypothetical protein
VILYRHAVTHIPLQGPKQAIIPGQAENSHERPYEEVWMLIDPEDDSLVDIVTGESEEPADSEGI